MCLVFFNNWIRDKIRKWCMAKISRKCGTTKRNATLLWSVQYVWSCNLFFFVGLNTFPFILLIFFSFDPINLIVFLFSVVVVVVHTHTQYIRITWVHHKIVGIISCVFRSFFCIMIDICLNYNNYVSLDQSIKLRNTDIITKSSSISLFR